MKDLRLADLALIFHQAGEVIGRAAGAPPRTFATAESCTGGLLGAALTAVPGSSASYLGGVVAYSDAVKVAQLGVPSGLISLHGAVSEEVAESMAEGARGKFQSTFGISTTGVAGPGSSESKPAGLIYVAVAGPREVTLRRLLGDHGRHLNRVNAVNAALELLLAALG